MFQSDSHWEFFLCVYVPDTLTKYHIMTKYVTQFVTCQVFHKIL